MKAIKCVFVLLVVMGTASGAGAKLAVKEGERIIVEGNNKFALELYAKLRAREGNLFFSPYSISTALAMTYAGARGETEAQMWKTLRFPTEHYKALDTDNQGRPFYRIERRPMSRERIAAAFGALQRGLKADSKKSGYELTVANALWGQKGYGFLKTFLKLTEKNYGAGLKEVDFIAATEAARETINVWVGKKTRNKIKNLIPKGVLNRLTRLVLTNAIYFKGNWARQFKKDRTKDAPFTLAGGEKVDVPMMNQTAEFNYMETEDFQGLELPYVDDELSMIILLPKQGDGLAEFEKTLTLESLSQWLARFRKRKVIVSVPKFKMTSQFRLAECKLTIVHPKSCFIRLIKHYWCHKSTVMFTIVNAGLNYFPIKPLRPVRKYRQMRNVDFPQHAVLTHIRVAFRKVETKHKANTSGWPDWLLYRYRQQNRAKSQFLGVWV